MKTLSILVFLIGCSSVLGADYQQTNNKAFNRYFKKAREENRQFNHYQVEIQGGEGLGDYQNQRAKELSSSPDIEKNQQETTKK